MSISDEEIESALSNLIDKGFVREVVLDGQVLYQVTEAGTEYFDALNRQNRNTDLNLH